jgi:hypothetical protein
MSFDEALREKAEHMVKVAEREASDAARAAARAAFYKSLEGMAEHCPDLTHWRIGVSDGLVGKLDADYHTLIVEGVVRGLTRKVLG